MSFQTEHCERVGITLLHIQEIMGSIHGSKPGIT